MTKDQEILNIILELEKNMVKNLATAITEASSQNLAQVFEKIFNNVKTAQRDVFDYMNNAGFYNLTYEDETKVKQTYEKNNKTLTNLEEI